MPTSMNEVTAKCLDNFWSKVNKSGPDECWEWSGKRARRGYGCIHMNRSKKDILAHRVAYFMFTGIDPGDLFVCHKCDNPPCCNPNHLFLGTHTDNIRDAAAKGRMPVGESSRWTKMTRWKVLEMRELFANGVSQKELATKFSVTNQTVSAIVRRKNWKHI